MNQEDMRNKNSAVILVIQILRMLKFYVHLYPISFTLQLFNNHLLELDSYVFNIIWMKDPKY